MNTDQMFDVPVQDASWRHATASDGDGLADQLIGHDQETVRLYLSYFYTHWVSN